MAIETVANSVIILILFALSSLASSGLLTAGVKLAKIKTKYRKTLLLAVINSSIYYFIFTFLAENTDVWYPFIIAQLPGLLLVKFIYRTDWSRATILWLGWSLFFLPIFLVLYATSFFMYGPMIYLAFGLNP